VIERTDQTVGRPVVLASLYRNGALTHSRQDERFIQVLGYSISAAEPAKARRGQNYCVILALIELSQSRIHIAANGLDYEIRTRGQDLGVAPKAAGADAGAAWQLLEGTDPGSRHQRIADILALADCAYVQARRKVGRQVFETVDRQVDSMVKDGIFKFFGEQALALLAQLWKRDVLHPVAGCRNDLYFDLNARMAGFELRLDPVGLPQGELAAPRSDYQLISQFILPF
jgi:hypothetical protein